MCLNLNQVTSRVAFSNCKAHAQEQEQEQPPSSDTTDHELDWLKISEEDLLAIGLFDNTTEANVSPKQIPQEQLQYLRRRGLQEQTKGQIW